jgi:hypothetical protein
VFLWAKTGFSTDDILLFFEGIHPSTGEKSFLFSAASLPPFSSANATMREQDAAVHKIADPDWHRSRAMVNISKNKSEGGRTMKSGVNNCWAGIAVLLLGSAVAFAQTEYQAGQQTSQTPQAQQGQQGGTGVKVNPSNVQQKAQTPPPSTANPATTIGNKVQQTAPAGTVSWVEQIDADGNGQAEQTTLAWDAQDKVLLSNSSGTFTCSDGSTGNGELLIAVNGAGNPRNRPVGSGFWLASLDKGQCGAKVNTLWGCKFDASGNPTTCGVAQLDQQNEDLTIVTAQPVR